MTNSSAGIVELSLIFGSVFALLIWELVSLKRDSRREADEQRARDSNRKL